MRRKLETDKTRDLGLKRKQFFMEMLAWNFKYQLYNPCPLRDEKMNMYYFF